MHPDLDACLRMVLDATRDGGPECSTRRDPKTWSVAEIVEHLQRAYLGTAKGFERCLEQGAPMATAPSLTQQLQGFAVINLGYFPAGREAPKYIIPTGALDLVAVLDAVRRDLARLDGAAVRTRAQFGRVKVVDHPILGAFSVDQWLTFHRVHTRHHEKQIRARR